MPINPTLDKLLAEQLVSVVIRKNFKNREERAHAREKQAVYLSSPLTPLATQKISVILKDGGFYLCTTKKAVNSAVGTGWMPSSSVLTLIPG